MSRSISEGGCVKNAEAPGDKINLKMAELGLQSLVDNKRLPEFGQGRIFYIIKREVPFTIISRNLARNYFVLFSLTAPYCVHVSLSGES